MISVCNSRLSLNEGRNLDPTPPFCYRWSSTADEQIQYLDARRSSFVMSGTSDDVAGGRNAERYFLVLGAAAADLWSDLPQELQQSLFERAVVLGHKSERDESLREQLAKFLHDHHARTQRA